MCRRQSVRHGQRLELRGTSANVRFLSCPSSPPVGYRDGLSCLIPGLSLRPVNLEERQRVAAYGLLVVEGRVLLARASASSAVPGRWFLPGGGLDFGETPESCVVREFEEEAGLAVQPRTLRQVLTDVTDLPERGERLHTVRVIYDVDLLGGTPRPETGGTTDEMGWYLLFEALDLPLMSFVRAMLAA